LNIITTYSILGDVVQNVGGGFIALRTLVGAGGDAHTYEPTPADSVALADADVVFENGLAFETWLDGLYESARSRAARVVVTEGITPITVAEHEDEHSDEAHDDAAATAEAGAHDDEHDHGEFDPHVWHDVEHIMHMTERVRDALAQADPANAQTYRANADAYMEQLQELDRLIREQVNTLLPERRKLVTTHDTFGYFAERYGFQVVGTALGSVSTEAADPSAQEIAILVEEIKAAGVPAIFAETITDNGLMERIAQEAGVELAPTLYTDALGEPGSDGATYIGMMRANVATIVEALSD
jgi:ABC-type Zn uptake system ZnuABC Zn-binding protein ZnuA